MLKKPATVLELKFLAGTGIFSDCLLVRTFPTLEYDNYSIVRIRVYVIQDCTCRKYRHKLLAVKQINCQGCVFSHP